MDAAARVKIGSCDIVVTLHCVAADNAIHLASLQQHYIVQRERVQRLQCRWCSLVGSHSLNHDLGYVRQNL
jgi:hypothetical protein